MKYTEEEKKSLKFLTDKRDEAYGLMQFEDGELYQLAEEEFNNYLTIEEIIDKQQKEIKELKSKTQIISPLYIKENYLPKEAIRKKIKEIDENGYWDFLEERDCEKTINILKELLGDE